MERSEASTQRKEPASIAALAALKEKLRFADWPLRDQRFIPGFNPLTAKLPFFSGYRLERKTLLPVVSSWVVRKYSFRQGESDVAFLLTVIVSQNSARDAAESLVLQIIASQMRSEPRVEFNTLGDVAVYRHPSANQSLAFLRNNIGINLENYSSPGRNPELHQLALQIDSHLKEVPSATTLVDDHHVPKIMRFKPKAEVIQPGERTDLDIEIKDNYPPHELLFRAQHGSYNQDSNDRDVWFFRAGPKTASAEVVLTVVNDLNLMAQARCSITIE